jgi:AAA domain
MLQVVGVMDITRALCPHCKDFPPHPDMQDGWCGNCEPNVSQNGKVADRGRAHNGARPPKAPKKSTEGDRPTEILVSSWQPVDLEAIAEGLEADTEPALLPRSDGITIIYPGKRHLIAGEPEGGKGWLALKATAEEVQAAHRVLYIDFESTAKEILDRLGALGVPLRDALEFLTYIRPDGPLDVDLPELGVGATLAILDGITEAMQLLGLDPNSSIDTAKFYGMTARPLADVGCAVLGIDHVVKDREGRGRWAIGSQHKIAGVDVAFGLETRKPFGRGIVGAISTLRLLKDRPGYLQQHTVGARVLADVRLDSAEEGVTVALGPPQDTAAADFRPTALMERVSRYLTLKSDQTFNAIADGVTGKRQFVQQALRVLVEEGYVEAKPGPRQSLIHSNLRPFREDEEGDE